jgi:hypothetical protein
MRAQTQLGNNQYGQNVDMGAAGSRRRQAGQSHGMINLANAKMSVNSSVALKQNLLQGN